MVPPTNEPLKKEHASVEAQVEEPAPRAPVCPPETQWDGLACAHARATCGGWDGLSCNPSGGPPPERTRAANEEFARIDADARTVCPEDDESRQVYSGNAPEIVKAMDAAMWRADQMRQRLENLRNAQQTPQWEVATFARSGSLYDCIWNSVRKSTPVLFTPQQQALLTKLNKMTGGLASNAQQVLVQIADTREAVATKWRSTRDAYLDTLETQMVRSYVTATILARRYALEGFSFTRASQRLPIVASILGDERMVHLLEAMNDPTDPQPDSAKRRHLFYVAHAFGVPR